MSVSDTELEILRSELERIKENCLYTAQGYFEAAKSAELWGRLMVFIPACVTAISALVIATGNTGPLLSSISAVSGAVAATASFIGSSKTAADYLASARAYTALRHEVQSKLTLLSSESDYEAALKATRELNKDYIRITATDMPMPNRFFAKASKRIAQGAAS